MTETMTRPDPILSYLSEWTAAKEDLRRLAKLGAVTTPMYRRALDTEALVMWTEQAAIHAMPTTPRGFAEKIRFLMAQEEQAAQQGDIFDAFLEDLAGREFKPKSS